MQVDGSQLTVTGLTVNEKVNVSQAYYKHVRAAASMSGAETRHRLPAASLRLSISMRET